MPSLTGPRGIAAAAALLVTAATTQARADISLSLYGDIDAGVATDGTQNGTSDTFTTAKLEFFTAASSGRWSFLAETLFEAGEDNDFGVDVERIQIGYLYRDWLRIAIGRFHTAIGYYNDGFHHGAFFMLPVARPTVVQFEDSGGLIPAHSVGVHADGRFAAGDSHIRYDLDLGNGRAADPTLVQNNHDTNRPKAFNVRLRFEPAAIEGLIIGGNVYFDAIPGRPVATDLPAVGPIHQWLFGAHVAYFEHDVQFVAEAYAIQDTEQDTGTSHTTYAAFAEAGRSFGELTPYARYQWTRYPSSGDPYYGYTQADGVQVLTAGVKDGVNDNIVLKAEAGVTFSSAPGADPVFSLTGQVAFAF